MMKKILLSVLTSMMLLATVMTVSAQQVYTPERGNPERKAILDAVRPILEVRVGPPVEFVVSWIRVYDNYAFVAVDPQRPGGGAINRKDALLWQDDISDGLNTYVLLTYTNNRWNVVDFAIGPTDVFWDGDPLYQQFPRAFTFPE